MEESMRILGAVFFFVFMFFPLSSFALTSEKKKEVYNNPPVREVIFVDEPRRGDVYRVVYSEPFTENGELFCWLEIQLMPGELAVHYPWVLAREPGSDVQIVIFPANSEEPLHYWELYHRYSQSCPDFEDMTVMAE
jgi:hypothetical protein